MQIEMQGEMQLEMQVGMPALKSSLLENYRGRV
jgi:hypothetical protein